MTVIWFFFATPTGTAMTLAPVLLDKGVRVIDLSADFRLKDDQEWSKWYSRTHHCPPSTGKLPCMVYQR